MTSCMRASRAPDNPAVLIVCSLHSVSSVWGCSSVAATLPRMVSRPRSPSKASVAHPWHIFFFYRALLNVCLLLFFLLRGNFVHHSILFSCCGKETQGLLDLPLVRDTGYLMRAIPTT